MTGVLDRARSDVAAGRAWKARDRLTGALAHRVDPQALDLLAEVHAGMGDLPAAGALWFVTGRDDESARQAVAAWRERHGHDPVQLWYSVPPLARQQPVVGEHLRHLHAETVAALEARQQPAGGGRGGVPEPDQHVLDRLFDVVLVCVVVLVVAVFGVGVVTVVRWVGSGISGLSG